MYQSGLVLRTRNPYALNFKDELKSSFEWLVPNTIAFTIMIELKPDTVPAEQVLDPFCFFVSWALDFSHRYIEDGFPQS